MKGLLTTTFLLLFVMGCSSRDLSQYKDNKPVLNLFEYFQGTTKGWGIVQDRKGNLTRQFIVEITGIIDTPNRIILEEDFSWSDGEKTQRIWTITRIDESRYTGRAVDVVDSATGQTSGNVLNWQYRLKLKVDESMWIIDFDDWMYLQPNGVLLNKASMSKFGIHVGEVTIVFQKVKK